uniref:Bifunctional riboflavin kinase/FMN phosphatase isoform X2 n=1 Tax=Rhizophora mucronata TaxID=61149 RepID=A0A2P2M3V0_RHIMU
MASLWKFILLIMESWFYLHAFSFYLYFSFRWAMYIYNQNFLLNNFRWCNIKLCPGANRLIKHLSLHNVPMALASNSQRTSIESKISYHQGWKKSFSAIIAGDEVVAPKPSPEM